jgi:tetratricopeptide (TPR) repeat protein
MKMRKLSQRVLTSFIALSVFEFGCNTPPKISTTSVEALAAYQDGVSHLDNFYFSQAARALHNALKLDSTFVLAWGKLALVSMNADDEPSAQKYIARAFDNFGHASEREKLYVRMWNHSIYFRQDAAIAVADSLLREYPDEPEAFVFRGRAYESRKRLDDAIKSYNGALAVDSTYPPAAMSLGYAYSQTGDQKKALLYMGRYIRLVPQSADPRASYADLLVRVGEYEEALRQYKKSLDIKPDYWYSHTQIGNVYTIAGRLRDAEAEFVEGMKEFPENKREAWGLSMRAALNLLRGKFELARDQYEQSFAADSSNAGLKYGEIEALIKLKKFDGARSIVVEIHKGLVRRNLAESPVMIGYYLAQARLLTAQREYERALDACDSARAFTTPLTRARVSQEEAEIYLQTKEFDRAFSSSEEALAINPNNPDALFLLAKIYHEKRDARMTSEIGGRLLAFWEMADPDFLKLRELRQLLDYQQSRLLSTQN